MTDSLDEILSANQKLYVLNQKLTEEVKRLREALERVKNRAVTTNMTNTEIELLVKVAREALERK